MRHGALTWKRRGQNRRIKQSLACVGAAIEASDGRVEDDEKDIAERPSSLVMDSREFQLENRHSLLDTFSEVPGRTQWHRVRNVFSVEQHSCGGPHLHLSRFRSAVLFQNVLHQSTFSAEDDREMGDGRGSRDVAGTSGTALSHFHINIATNSGRLCHLVSVVL